LKQAGAVLLGKTNMHEFAYGVTSNNPHYGPVRNPWDLQRIPAAPAAAPPRRSPPASASAASARTPVVQSAFQLPSAAWWA